MKKNTLGISRRNRKSPDRPIVVAYAGNSVGACIREHANKPSPTLQINRVSGSHTLIREGMEETLELHALICKTVKEASELHKLIRKTVEEASELHSLIRKALKEQKDKQSDVVPEKNKK